MDELRFWNLFSSFNQLMKGDFHVNSNSDKISTYLISVKTSVNANMDAFRFFNLFSSFDQLMKGDFHVY